MTVVNSKNFPVFPNTCLFSPILKIQAKSQSSNSQNFCLLEKFDHSFFPVSFWLSLEHCHFLVGISYMFLAKLHYPAVEPNSLLVCMCSVKISIYTGRDEEVRD